MKERRRFLGIAAIFGILEAGLVLAAVLLVGAAQDMNAASENAENDHAWAQLSARVLEWPEIDQANGLQPEAIVTLLGPPLRARRPDPLFGRCSQTYLYSVNVDGERHGIGLCINRDGIMDGIVGGRGGMTLEMRTISGGPADLVHAAFLGCLVGVPVATRSASKRRGPFSRQIAVLGLNA